MPSVPDGFEPSTIAVTAAGLGKLGVIVGVSRYIRDWIGALQPAPTFGDWEKLLMMFEADDADALDIQLHDLTSGESWSGEACHLVAPEPDFPWYELWWHDERSLAPQKPLLSELGDKLGGLLRRLLTDQRE